jgi:peptidoglycan hydrolase-like protein with peptidoglycan-binding domain
VRLIQTALKARGLYAHQVNGIFGEETELAVKAFQKTNDLVDNGFVAAETWR